MKMKKLNKKRYELKKKLRGRQRVFAGWNSLSHPSITEIFTHSNFDFIVVDMEHSTTSQEQAQRIIAACHANETLCLARIASHDMETIKRLLDSGADGIIAPMVSTPKETEQLISWVKYPPLGRRSFGVARSQGYGFNFDEYVKNWNKNSIFIVQIESIQGVDNIDKILSYDDVDGAMIGPYDLSGSLNIPGELDNPLVAKSCKKVINACKKHGKSCGNHFVKSELKNLKKAFSDGFTFAVLSSDVFLLWQWTEKITDIIDRLR